jgi:hypothetical protein
VRFGEVYLLAGALVVLALVYVMTFPGAWDQVIEDGAHSYDAPASVYTTIALTAVVVAAQVWMRRGRAALADVAVQGGLLVLAAVAATWPAWTGYALLFNAVYFGLAAALVTHGYLAGDDRYVNVALVAVGIGLITRYIDVFWSLLTGSVFFIAGGVLLLALAFALERIRSHLIANMEAAAGGSR